MYTLHVGVKPWSLQTALELASSFADAGDTVVDGTGWESWSEAVGKDTNDRVTLHMTVEVPDQYTARCVAAALRRWHCLTFMKNGVGDRLVDAVVTDRDDWGCYQGREGDALLLNKGGDVR